MAMRELVVWTCFEDAAVLSRDSWLGWTQVCASPFTLAPSALPSTRSLFISDALLCTFLSAASHTPTALVHPLMAYFSSAWSFQTASTAPRRTS